MYDVDDGFPNTAPVGSFPKGASRYGVKDVVGNVWEWVADWYGPYAQGRAEGPQGPRDGRRARHPRRRVERRRTPSWVRPTFRYKDSPSQAKLRHRVPLREVSGRQ